MDDHFDDFVTRGEPDDCWLWVGGKDPDGYGIYRIPRVGSVRAHRYAFEREHGFLPPQVCHSCDVPSCVNPAHLWPGNAQSNHDDMVAKGRRPVRREGAKLTEAKVRELRDRYSAGGVSMGQLAKEYQVSKGAIQQAIERRSWRSVA